MNNCALCRRRHTSNFNTIRRRLNQQPLLATFLIFTILLLTPLTLRLFFILWKEVEFFPSFPLHSESFSKSIIKHRQPSDHVDYIHQTWKDSNLPSRFATWSESWKKHFPKWNYKLWTDADNEAFFKLHYPQFYPVWKQLPGVIERVDSVRYLYLHHFGGIYADLDAECLKTFSHLLKNSNCSVILGSMEPGNFLSSWRFPSGLVQNSFMYSVPGDSFWLDLIKEITHISGQSQFKKLIGTHPLTEDRTGPLMLMRVLSNNWHLYKDRLCIYKPLYFNPWSWMQSPENCQTMNQMSDDELSQCKANFRSSYVLQYHTQVWRKGKQNIR